jgi:hypothetical protein
VGARPLTLAIAFWNLALLNGKEHDEMLAGLVDTIVDGEPRAAELRAIAADMVALQFLLLVFAG